MNTNKVNLNDQSSVIQGKGVIARNPKPFSGSGKLRKFFHTIEDKIWRKIVLGIPFLWMIIFFLIPFLLVFQISLTESTSSSPPYTSMLESVEELTVSIKLIFYNYSVLIADDIYYIAYLNSVKIAFAATVSCLIIGYIIAYVIARATPKWRNIMLMAVILPFWTSFLLRAYAWMGLLQDKGMINNVLLWIGIIDEPLKIMYTNTAMYIVFVYAYLPFMILPLYANLEKLDITLDEAAADLGAKPFITFLTITLPLSIPGIIAGCMLTFIPAIGEFIIPTLVGGPDSLMIGRVLYDEFASNIDWPLACAVSVVLLLFLVVPFMLYEHWNTKHGGADLI